MMANPVVEAVWFCLNCHIAFRGVPMRRALVGLLTGVAFGVISQQIASAADMPVKAPPVVAAAYSWTGWYIGGNAGGVVGMTEPGLAIDDSLGRYFTFGPGSGVLTEYIAAVGGGHFRNNGFTGGGQIGRLEQSGSAVWGIEADFEYFNPKGSNSVTATLPSPAFALPGPTLVPFTVTNSVSGSWLSTVRARFGIARDNWLFYGTVGAAFARVSFSATYADATTAPPQVSASLRSNFSATQTMWGIAAGGGAEYAFGGNWSLRAEYLYVDLRHFTGSTVAFPTVGTVPTAAQCPPSAGAGFCSVFTYDVRLREHIGRIALNYKLY